MCWISQTPLITHSGPRNLVEFFTGTTNILFATGGHAITMCIFYPQPLFTAFQHLGRVQSFVNQLIWNLLSNQNAKVITHATHLLWTDSIAFCPSKKFPLSALPYSRLNSTHNFVYRRSESPSALRIYIMPFQRSWCAKTNGLVIDNALLYS